MAQKSNILVVDDEDTICEVLKLNLELAGYNVDTANSAEAAMKMQLSDTLEKGRLPYCREYVTLSVRIQGQRRDTDKADLF